MALDSLLCIAAFGKSDHLLSFITDHRTASCLTNSYTGSGCTPTCFHPFVAFLVLPLETLSSKIIRSEAGIPHREWANQYGPVVRVVGPVGVERLVFLKPEALHKILVSAWLHYPRVPLFLFFARSDRLSSSPPFSGTFTASSQATVS